MALQLAVYGKPPPPPPAAQHTVILLYAVPVALSGKTSPYEHPTPHSHTHSSPEVSSSDIEFQNLASVMENPQIDSQDR